MLLICGVLKEREKRLNFASRQACFIVTHSSGDKAAYSNILKLWILRSSKLFANKSDLFKIQTGLPFDSLLGFSYRQ